jgi:hypothetical protein
MAPTTNATNDHVFPDWVTIHDRPSDVKTTGWAASSGAADYLKVPLGNTWATATRCTWISTPLAISSEMKLSPSLLTRPTCRRR